MMPIIQCIEEWSSDENQRLLFKILTLPFKQKIKNEKDNRYFTA